MSWPSRWPTLVAAARAAAPPAEPTRQVIRPAPAGRARASRSSGRRRQLLRRSAARSRAAGSSRPTSATTRPSATSLTGWPGSGVEEALAEAGAEPGAEVLIGDGTTPSCSTGTPTSPRPAAPRGLRAGAAPTRRLSRHDAVTGPVTARPAAPTSPPRPRVVVKVGSSSLTTADGAIDGRRDRRARRRAGRPRQGGGQVVLVSSGAIASGLAPLGLPRRPRDLATQQAAASVGQGLLIARYTAAFAAARRQHRPGPADRRRPDAPRRTTATPSAPWTGCSSSASCRWSTRTTRWPPTRSGSATTTGSRRWSRT